jgi:hypothetical protein
VDESGESCVGDRGDDNDDDGGVGLTAALNTVRTIEDVAVTLLRPSECRFLIDDLRGCLEDDVGILVSASSLSLAGREGVPADGDGNLGIFGAPTQAMVLEGAAGADLRPLKQRRWAKVTSAVDAGTPVRGQPDIVAADPNRHGDTGGRPGAAGGALGTVCGCPGVGTSGGECDRRCIVRIRLVGPGFLRHMVRRLVGCAIAVGKGRLPTTYIRDQLTEAAAAKDASTEVTAAAAAAVGVYTAGPEHTKLPYTVAPGRGLWLERTYLAGPVPDADEHFWADRNWCNNGEKFAVKHGIALTDLHLDFRGELEREPTPDVFVPVPRSRHESP